MNALFCCTKQGMKVTVEDMKSIQLNAFIEPEVFQVIMVTLMECFIAFGFIYNQLYLELCCERGRN